MNTLMNKTLGDIEAEMSWNLANAPYTRRKHFFFCLSGGLIAAVQQNFISHSLNFFCGLPEEKSL